MKAAHGSLWHMPHKHTISGMLIGGILIAAALIDMMVLEERIFTNRTVFILLVPGASMFLRALHPPIGLSRTVLLLAGGVLVGLVPLMLVSEDTRVLWSALACGLAGAAMLGFGFSIKPETT